MENKLIQKDILLLRKCTLQIVSKSVTLYLNRSFNTAHSSSITRNNFFVKIVLKDSSFLGLFTNSKASQKQQRIQEINNQSITGYGQSGLPPKKPFCYLSDINDCLKFAQSLVQDFKLQNQQILKSFQITKCLKEVLKKLFDQVFENITKLEDQKSLYFDIIRLKVKYLLSNTDESIKHTQYIYFYVQAFLILNIAKQMSEKNHQYNAARSSFQFCILDLIGKIQYQSVSDLICSKQQIQVKKATNQQVSQSNLNNHYVNYSFYTISHEESIESMLENGLDGLKYTNCIKIKFDNNIEKLIELLKIMDQKGVGDKWIIDANACWSPSDYQQFQSRFSQLIESNQSIKARLLFIQQPFPIFQSLCKQYSQQEIDHVKLQWQKIKLNTKFILIADESFSSLKSLSQVKRFSHGINIKMEKCGGPLQTIKILQVLNTDHIDYLMFGSMVSTHLGCTQTFQFYKFATFFDIDGALLVKQPQISGGFLWGGNKGISKVHGRGLALNQNDLQKLI